MTTAKHRVPVKLQENPKSEGRNPKENPKEIRNPALEALTSDL